jgi:hypothetical protein
MVIKNKKKYSQVVLERKFESNFTKKLTIKVN